jgi:hypothetical protein
VRQPASRLPRAAPALLADPVLSELAAASMAAVDRKH